MTNEAPQRRHQHPRHGLRPYQRQVGQAVLRSVLERRGHTFTVEMARQGGKNELSAQLEVLLLTLFSPYGGNGIKAAPTFSPQCLISLRRLKDRLAEWGLDQAWVMENGFIVRLNRARQMFLSADGASHVVGATAHILLEIDEAQDVDKDKFYKDFRPMGASTNVTTVLYGTAWDQATLLEEVKQHNLELERRDGVQRHFRFDWEEVARHNPDYRRYVEAERARLGDSHPLFMTQYRLLPVANAGGLFSPGHIAQLQGDHPRQRQPKPGAVYVAGIDLAGEGDGADAGAPTPSRGRDSTVLTIGELDFSLSSEVVKEPGVRVVEQYWWTGTPHVQLYGRLVDLLRQVWGCKRVVVDATGLGQPVAAFLSKALGSAVTPFVITAPSKSRLGFDLLAAVNGGRIKLYARDGSPECQEFWRQSSQARAAYRANLTMNFYVEPSQGHDDFLMSLALLTQAAAGYLPRAAKGRIPHD